MLITQAWVGSKWYDTQRRRHADTHTHTNVASRLHLVVIVRENSLHAYLESTW